MQVFRSLELSTDSTRTTDELYVAVVNMEAAVLRLHKRGRLTNRVRYILPDLLTQVEGALDRFEAIRRAYQPGAETLNDVLYDAAASAYAELQQVLHVWQSDGGRSEERIDRRYGHTLAALDAAIARFNRARRRGNEPDVLYRGCKTPVENYASITRDAVKAAA